MTYIDMIEDGYHYDIKPRIPPTHNHTRLLGRCEVCGPKHTHQAIALYHVKPQACELST